MNYHFKIGKTDFYFFEYELNLTGTRYSWFSFHRWEYGFSLKIGPYGFSTFKCFNCNNCNNYNNYDNDDND